MREYSIIRADTIHALENLVNKFLERGYVTVGGVIVHHGKYLQAVVLPEITTV